MFAKPGGHFSKKLLIAVSYEECDFIRLFDSSTSLDRSSSIFTSSPRGRFKMDFNSGFDMANTFIYPVRQSYKDTQSRRSSTFVNDANAVSQ